MQRKRAFTLIELLVVIAIIAILAAILFPVFAKARERAKQSKSLNNIRQLAIGITSYATDYGDALPGWVDNSSTGAGQFAHNTWDEQIDPNVKSKDVYNNGDSGIQSSAQPKPYTRVLTYGLNGLLIAPKATFDGNAGFTTVNAANPPAISTSSSVSNPAGTILLAELQTSSWGSAGTYASFSTPRAATGTSGTGPTTGSSQYQAAHAGWIDISPKDWVSTTGVPADYYDPYTNYTGWGVARDLYGGGGSYAFMDGHVKFMKLPDTVGIGKTYGTGTAVSTSNAFNTLNTNNMWNPASGG